MKQRAVINHASVRTTPSRPQPHPPIAASELANNACRQMKADTALHLRCDGAAGVALRAAVTFIAALSTFIASQWPGNWWMSLCSGVGTGAVMPGRWGYCQSRTKSPTHPNHTETRLIADASPGPIYLFRACLECRGKALVPLAAREPHQAIRESPRSTSYP